MKYIAFKKNLFCLLILFLSGCYFLEGQDLTPGPPVLHSADILPGTDSLSVSWKLSDSSNVAYYCVYTNYGKGWIKLDSTFNPVDTQLVFRFPPVLKASQRICLAAVPVTGDFNSPLSNEHHTVFLEERFDSCKMQMKLKWSAYSGWGSSLIGYTLYRILGNKDLENVADIPADSTQYSLPVEAGKDYCLVLKALSIEGFHAFSNSACLSSAIPQIPEWIHANQAVVTDNQIVLLDFSIDPASDPHAYLLTGSSAPDGKFDSVAFCALSGEKEISLKAGLAGPLPLYYRLYALNVCGDTLVSSNLATAMDLQAQISGDMVKVNWTPYIYWEEGVSQYAVYRITDDNQFEKAGETTGAVSCFEETVASLEEMQIQGRICYFVEALSNQTGPDGINAISRSANACITPESRYVVPEAFTPNGDGMNDVFAPVFSFSPAEYHLVISSLVGATVFQTSNTSECWDGRGSDGRTMPPGNYLWSLYFRDYKGNAVRRKGIVSLFLP